MLGITPALPPSPLAQFTGDIAQIMYGHKRIKNLKPKIDIDHDDSLHMSRYTFYVLFLPTAAVLKHHVLKHVLANLDINLDIHMHIYMNTYKH